VIEIDYLFIFFMYGKARKTKTTTKKKRLNSEESCPRGVSNKSSWKWSWTMSPSDRVTLQSCSVFH